MRIGVVTASYPRSEGEHAGNFVAAHVAALRAAGHQVDVVGAHTIASPLFYKAGAPDELERGGLGAYLAAGRFSIELTREVARRARGTQPPDDVMKKTESVPPGNTTLSPGASNPAEWQLIIAHWLAPSALAAALATTRVTNRHAARIPILAIAHGGDIHTLRRLRLLGPTLYALRARGVQLAFVSEELRTIARAAAPGLGPWLDGALVQPMGVDLSRFASRDAPGLKELKPSRSILVVARLVPIKGVDVAIRAMQLLRTPIRLVIAGDGPERARLEALARSGQPAGGAIELVGAVDASRLGTLLAEADCVVIPSRVLPNGRTEGTPMIALEALAAGAPVIASAVGGLRELPGITRVRPDDPQALAAAIDRVLAAPQAHATNAFDLAMFDWSYVSERLLDHAMA